MRNINLVVVHHSASGRDVTTREMIKKWHLTHGYSDIGYHYIITGDGKLHVGRPAEKIGAHALGYNTNSLGVCLTGNFETEEPSEAQINTLIQVLATLCKRHELTTDQIKGHNLLNQTACPGKNLISKFAIIKKAIKEYLK